MSKNNNNGNYLLYIFLGYLGGAIVATIFSLFGIHSLWYYTLGIGILVGVVVGALKDSDEGN